MLIDCASSFRSSSTQKSQGPGSPSRTPSRTPALGFAVVPKSGISLEELMTPRLRPAPATSGQSSSSLQLVLEDEESYTYVKTETGPVGGALLHKSVEDVQSVQDVIDRLAAKESPSARSQRQSSVISWASTTIEAVHEHARYDSDSASSLTPSPRGMTIRPPDAGDASYSPTPALSSSRAISVSTSRPERSSPDPTASAWSGRADSPGDDVDCDIHLDDAQPSASPKAASASKSLWYGARPHRPEAKSQSPPRNKTKSPSAHIRQAKAKAKARGRAASRRAPAASSGRSFKCKYLDPVSEIECDDGRCVKLYDLVRHLVIHINDEVRLVREGRLVHHPDGAPCAEDETPAPLLGAMVPNVDWEYLQSIGLSKQYDLRAEKLLRETAEIHRCYDPLCPSRPGEYRQFPRRDTLSKHLRDQHRGRKLVENRRMQPPDAVDVDRNKLVVIFGARHADRLMGISGSGSPDDSEEMDVAPQPQPRSAALHIKTENVSPQVPLLQLEYAPAPRLLPAYPESSPRGRGTKKRVSFADSPSYATPVLAPDMSSTSSSPIIQTPALHSASFLTHHRKPRNLGTPESFSSPLPRSPLRLSTLPPPLEEEPIQSHLSVPLEASRPPPGLLFSGVSDPRSPLIYSPGLPSPAVLPNSPLPDYSNLSPAAAMVPQALSPHLGQPATLQPLGSGLTPDVHGLHLELGQFQDPSYGTTGSSYGASFAQQTPHTPMPEWQPALWTAEELQQLQQLQQPPPPVLSVDPDICLYTGPYASGSADPSPRSAYDHVPATFSATGDFSAAMIEGTDSQSHSQFLHPFGLDDMSMAMAGGDFCEESPYGYETQLPHEELLLPNKEDIIESMGMW